MKKFIKPIVKSVPFMDDTISIRKLSAGAVQRIGEESKKIDTNDEAGSMMILAVILNEGVVLEEGEDKITAELLSEFPLDELNSLSSAIMQYAGVVGGQDEGNAS